MGIRAQPASFADLLQRYRRAAGLTQEELAERAHLSVRGISNLERGVRRLPQRGTITLLAEALALSATDRADFEAAARGLARQPRGEGLPALLVGAPDIGALQDCRRARSWAGSVRRPFEHARDAGGTGRPAGLADCGARWSTR